MQIRVGVVTASLFGIGVSAATLGVAVSTVAQTAADGYYHIHPLPRVPP